MRLAIAAALILSPTLAAAQARTFSLPQGCTAYLTVQSKACQVSHHFTCEGDPEGLQRRVDLDEEGVSYIGAIDAEAQWMESFHVNAGYSERLGDNPADPASFSELTATNRDSYDFTMVSDQIGTTRFVGEDTLTGEVVTIDGVTLDRTAYQIRAIAEDGTELWRAEGNEFISREWRMFLSGVSRYSTPNGDFEDDNSPVEFIFPGDAGFLSANPKFGCGVVMSSWAPE